MTELERRWQDGSLVGATVEVTELGVRRKVVAIYRDIPGGVRLNGPVGGIKSWNIDALTLIDGE